jgi:S-sulfo-L-cysteine synthase (3-phospho-L-serine-dependent)
MTATGSPSSDATRVGTGSCPLVLGECVQGRLSNGRHFLITAPIGLRSRAEFLVDPSLDRLVVEHPWRIKSLQAVIRYLEREGLPPVGRLRLSTALNPGQGFGTSTADIAASVQAAAAAWGRRASPFLIARIAAAIEPSDGSMFPGCVAFAHREGVLLERLGTLPSFVALVICTAGVVDTVQFDERRKDFSYASAEQRDLLSAWDMVRRANRCGDLALLGRAATRSALINQRFLPKPYFADLLRFVKLTGLQGLLTAHSGTVQALLLDPARPDFREQLDRARCFLDRLGVPASFELSNRPTGRDPEADGERPAPRRPPARAGRPGPGNRTRSAPRAARTVASPLDLIRDVCLVPITPRHPSLARAPLWAQLELGLPGGMKDRVALRMVEDAEARGALCKGGVIVESSSGSLAEGLARVGALKGYRVTIVTDPRIDELTKAKLRALGAELEIVDTYDRVGGWQSVRLRRLREVLERVPGAFWARQYDSPSNPAAYVEVGAAIAETLDCAIGALVGPVGTGGSLCGLAHALRAHVPDLRVVAVDAAGSVLFHQPNRQRLQSGHGNSLIPGNLEYEVIDEVHWVSDGEAFNACRELARRTGIFAGGSSGAAYIVASWLAQRYDERQHVVAILPDRGDRYWSTIYSDTFMAERGLLAEVAAAEPEQIRYGVDVAEHWSYAELPHDGSLPYHAPDTLTSRAVAAQLDLEGDSVR